MAEKSPEMRTSRFLVLVGAGVGPFLHLPESLGMKALRQTAPMEVVGRIIDADQEAQMEFRNEDCSHGKD